MATATVNLFDYRDVVADLTRRIEELTVARNALQGMLIADGAAKEISSQQSLIPVAAPTPIQVVWPKTAKRKSAVKPVKKVGRPSRAVKTHAASKHTVVIVPEPDNVDSKLSLNQAIYRALADKSLTSKQLKAKVIELRPGTEPGSIDSAVHYLKSKSLIGKQFETMAFYLIDQRMQNGTQA